MIATERTTWWTLVLLSIVAALCTCTATVADPDLWGHTLYGLRTLDNEVLVERADPFSYTAPGALWLNHEWLTERCYGLLWRHTGELGLWWWRNGLVAAVFGIGAAAIWRARVGIGTTILLVVFAAQTLEPFCMFIRPQLATFVLLAAWLLIVRRHWDDPRDRTIWWLPCLSALWVNLHGGFLAGLAIHGVVTLAHGRRAWFEPAARRQLRDIVLVGIAAGLATLANPYGWHMHQMLWVHLVPAQAVREWAPLWSAGGSLIYYLPFVPLAVALVASRRWQAIELLVMLATAAAALLHLRHVALLSIATLILLPLPLDDALGRLLPRLTAAWNNQSAAWRPLLATTLAASGLFASQIVYLHGWTRHGLSPWQIGVESLRQTPGVPLRALTVLSHEQLDGNLITDYAWAQYVLWHRFPNNRVAFDGRYRTVYPLEVERSFLALLRNDPHDPATGQMLDDPRSEIVLLPSTAPASNTVARRPDWVEIYADDQARLFVRRLPRFAQTIASVRDGLLGEPSVQRWNAFPAAPE